MRAHRHTHNTRNTRETRARTCKTRETHARTRKTHARIYKTHANTCETRANKKEWRGGGSPECDVVIGRACVEGDDAGARGLLSRVQPTSNAQRNVCCTAYGVSACKIKPPAQHLPPAPLTPAPPSPPCSAMSFAFWADACNSAFNKPLQTLIDTAHASCGVTVRRAAAARCVRCMWLVTLLLRRLPRIA